MKLYKVRQSATWIDPFGDSHKNQAKYVRVLEVVEPEPTGEFKRLSTGYGDGPDHNWDSEIIGLPDGRKWVPIQNRIDFWGGTWYRPLFEERDPALDPHEIGPQILWLSESDIRTKRCVNLDGKAVDIEGNLL